MEDLKFSLMDYVAYCSYVQYTIANFEVPVKWWKLKEEEQEKWRVQSAKYYEAWKRECIIFSKKVWIGLLVFASLQMGCFSKEKTQVESGVNFQVKTQVEIWWFCSVEDSDYIYAGGAGGKVGRSSKANTNNPSRLTKLITQVYNTSETSKRISKHTRETLGYMY